MFDFKNIPFYDNHTHTTDISNKEITSLELIKPFLHGLRDNLVGEAAGQYGISPGLEYHLENLGVVKTLVHHLSGYFGCEPTLDAVVKERNKRTKNGMAAYAKELYEDQNIIGETVDAGEPMGDPQLDCFPTRIFRLFQMDPLFRKLLIECSDYDELKNRYMETIRAAIAEGFIGIKCHVFEILYCPVTLVEDQEAKPYFSEAVAGEQNAYEKVYLSIFANTLLLCQELDIPIHIHTGCTGNPSNDLLHNCDPLSIAPFLNNPKYSNTTIVFLHSNYPNIRNAALMTHAYPNVWVDMSWVLPWISLNFAQCLEETLGVAPHSKILFGTGQHDHPEFAWMSAKIAKTTLAKVLENAVNNDLISIPQAQETAEMILYKNAKRLYKF